MESTGKPEDKPVGRPKFIPAEAEMPVDLQMEQPDTPSWNSWTRRSSTDQLACVPVILSNQGEKSCVWKLIVSDKRMSVEPDSGILHPTQKVICKVAVDRTGLKNSLEQPLITAVWTDCPSDVKLFSKELMKGAKVHQRHVIALKIEPIKAPYAQVFSYGFHPVLPAVEQKPEGPKEPEEA